MVAVGLLAPIRHRGGQRTAQAFPRGIVEVGRDSILRRKRRVVTPPLRRTDVAVRRHLGQAHRLSIAQQHGQLERVVPAPEAGRVEHD